MWVSISFKRDIEKTCEEIQFDEKIILRVK